MAITAIHQKAAKNVITTESGYVVLTAATEAIKAITAAKISRAIIL